MIPAPPRSRRLAPVDLALPLPPADAVFEQGLYVPLAAIEIAETEGTAVVVNGDLALSWVGSTFDGTVEENGQPQRGEANVLLRGAAALELAVDAGADVAGVLRLATIPLPPFSVGTGIEVSPFLQVRLHLAASADGDARLAVVAPFRLGTGHAFDGSAHSGMSSSPRHSPEVGLPDADVSLAASVDLQVLLAFMIGVEGIPIGGPVVGTSIGTILDLDPLAGADLDATLGVVGGWTFLGLDGLPDIPDDLRPLHRPIRFDVSGPDGPLSLEASPTRWSRLFDVGGFDTAPAALTAEAGSVVVGTSPSPWLATLDGAGVPLTQSTSEGVWQPNCLARAADGDILAAGRVFGAARADRYSPTGEPRWTRTVEVPDALGTGVVAIAPLSSGGAVVTGTVTRGTGQTPLLVRIDDDGAIAWSVEVDAGAGSSAPSLAGLAESPAGDVIAVGEVSYTEDSDPPIDRTNALILRIDADGAPLAAYALGGTSFESATRVAVAEDGSYAIGGWQLAPPNSWLAALGPDDSLRWAATYRSRPDDEEHVDVAALTGLAALPDGFLACGTVSIPGSDAWLMRVDAEGMPVWVRCYAGADSTDVLSDVLPLPDGVLACGSTDVGREADLHSDVWMVRTSVDGMLRFTAESDLACQVTAPSWERLADHVIRPLDPTATPVTLEDDPAAELLVDPATAFGELLTD